MPLQSSWVLETVSLIALLLYAFYKYATRNFNYWQNKGIPFEKPTPFLGNFGDVFFFRRSIADWFQKLYNSVSDAPYYGIYIFDEPRLIIKSPELIKRIMISDFNNFCDRSMACPDHNEIERDMLFIVRNPEWRIVRSKLSPLFTSARLKNMFHLMLDISVDMNRYIENGTGRLEFKSLCSRYTVEVIAQCSFGIKAKSFETEDPEFWRFAKNLFEFNTRNAIHHFSFFFRQQWVKRFKLNFNRNSDELYLIKVFLDVMEARKGAIGQANDLIDIINELRKCEQFKKDKHFEGPKVAAQALMFFQAGYETTSTGISFALYELCMHPSIQTRLREEILANIETHGGITWEGLNEMKYLDMCISETLRKYPALPFIDRECNSDYPVPGTDFVIEKGMNVYVPLLGLHYDEKYFKDPQSFDPERFANWSNDNTEGPVHIPFGTGPRNCIGGRFGLMATKIALCQLISNYEFVKNDKTPDPIVFATNSLLLASKSGLQMTVKKFVSHG